MTPDYTRETKPAFSPRTRTQIASFTEAADRLSVTELCNYIRNTEYEVTGIGNTRVAVQRANRKDTPVFKFSKDTQLDSTTAREPAVHADAASALGDILCPAWSLPTHYSPVTVMPYCTNGDRQAVTHIQSALDSRGVAYDGIDINPDNCGYVRPDDARLIDYRGLF